jgi:hypothetical protein
MRSILKIPKLLSPNQEAQLLKWRSSDFFIISTIFMAVFGDIFLYAVIIPVLPFSLSTRLQTPEEKGN